MSDAPNPRTDARIERMRAAGITEADEEYAWEALKRVGFGESTPAERLRIRAVAGFPHMDQLEAPTLEEMIDCGLSEVEAREYVDGWTAEDASASMDQSLAMSAACIAGARALDVAPLLERVTTALRQLREALECSPVWPDWQIAPEVVFADAVLAEVDALEAHDG